MPPGRATTVTSPAAVAERVLDQRVEHAVQVGGRAERGLARGGLDGLDAAALACRPSARRRGRPPRRGRAPPAARRPRRPGRARAARRGSPPGGRARPVAASISSWTSGSSRGGARLLEPQPQAGERRAQLVRGVGHEVALAGDEPLQPRRHVVEGAREAALLGAALDAGADAQVALRHLRRGVVEPPQRAGDLARDQHAGGEAEHEHEHADRRQAERRAPGRARDVVDALGDAHGADALARGPRSARRWRGSPGPACRCGAGPGRVAARSAAAISGPVAVVGAQPVGAGGVGQQRAVAVDHHDARRAPLRGRARPSRARSLRPVELARRPWRRRRRPARAPAT